VGANFCINGHKAFKCYAPLLLMYIFFDGERVLHLQGHLTMAESILANRYLLFECELALKLVCTLCLLQRVALLTACYHHRAKGCRQESPVVWKVV